MYDLVFITQLPSFYKVNLYNEIAKKRKILVIFIGNSSQERASDFVSMNLVFDYHFLGYDNFEDVSQFKATFNLIRLMSKINHKKVVVSGWNLFVFWVVVFLSPKNKNCLVLESSVEESQVAGLKGGLKKIFLKRISLVFASGKLHRDLLLKLNFKAQTKLTKGVGLINKNTSNFKKNELHYKKKFLFIGRMVEIKNIHKLVKLFKELEEFELKVIGQGPLLDELSTTSSHNIHFLSHVDNMSLFDIICESNFLILPSLSEPWGLVVEEALSCRTPVIISKQCGASELITHHENGFVFDGTKIEDLKKILLSIDDKCYQSMVENITPNMIKDKDIKQIEAYCLGI